MVNTWKWLSLFLFVTSFVLFIIGDFTTKLVAKIKGSIPQTQSKLIDFPYWHDRTTLFARLDCRNKIVIMGTSLTNQCEWNELYSRNDIAQRGISGDFTFGIYKRLDVCINQRPKAIFLEAGINDIGRNVPMDTIKSYYKMIITAIADKNIPLYIQSTLCIGTKSAYEYKSANIKVGLLNEFLKAECKSANVHFIDVNHFISPNGLLPSSLTNDGTHLNGAGYEIWKGVCQPYIDKIPHDLPI